VSTEPEPMTHAEKIQWMIDTSGWCAVPVAVSEDPPRPGYTYTIGFELTWGHPEVIILGLQPAAARGLLGLIADQLANGGDVPEGVFAGLLDNDLACAMLPISAPDLADICPGIVDFYQRQDVALSQFLWPDRAGHFPWQEGYDERLRLAQPVLGDWGHPD
jgi:hypothetical protein